MTKQKISRPLFLALALAIGAVYFLLVGLGGLEAKSNDPAIGREVPTAITRPQDYVSMTGADFPALLGVPLAELVLYTYDGATWNPIPFQIDQISGTTYVVDDGDGFLFDADDELVFMGADSGQATTCTESGALVPTDHNRHAVIVTDPLSSLDTGFVYVYTETLPTSPTVYQTWDQLAQTSTGDYGASYVAEFGAVVNPQLLGLANLDINGTTNVLDRMKVRLEVTGVADFVGCWLTVDLDYDEETAVTDAGLPPTMTLPIDGPIRALSEGGTLQIAMYGSRMDFFVQLSAQDIIDGSGGQLCDAEIDLLRTSLDMNDPGTTLIDTYYDSLGNTATIDGVADTIVAPSYANWVQVNGGAAGPGGMVTIFTTVVPGAGTANHHYYDMAPGCTVAGEVLGDTGDGNCYGDAGISVVGASRDPIQVGLTSYILPPGTDANVGAQYQDWMNNPLQTAVNSENCVAAPSNGTISGLATMQSRADHTGTVMEAWSGGAMVDTTVSDASGAYTLTVPAGSYTVTAEATLYLDGIKTDVAVTAGANTPLATVTMMGGDANDSDMIDIFDLTIIGAQFGATGCPLPDPRADINASCSVDIFDLSLTGANFGQSSPVPWP